MAKSENSKICLDLQFFQFSGYFDSPSSTLFSASPIFAIIRFFRNWCILFCDLAITVLIRIISDQVSV